MSKRILAEDKKYNINVSVQTEFVADHSDVGNNQYTFSYKITIQNVGTIGAQLISRHWIITDSNDKLREVYGDGVVGEQPLLKPGETYQYTSSAVLDTPVGTMRGNYNMLAEDGTHFNAPINQFILSVPRTLH